jgi:hemin uptake protein HemP
MKVITNLAPKEQSNSDEEMVSDRSWRDNIKSSQIKKLSTETLFAEANEVMIEHQNETYVLRITKQNKLILTK